jgi:ABC-type nitrate/sulfonate/bicarbonate transport system permease component
MPGPRLTSVAEMMEWGMLGPAASRRRAAAVRLGSVAAFMGVWALAAGIVEVGRLFNPIFLPGPWVVVGNVLGLAADGQLWEHVRATLGRVALGFAGGAALALTLGLLAGRLPAVRTVVEPVVELLRPVPPLAMLPLFIVWVGIGEGSKVGFITYATFFPMFLTTVHAVSQIDPRLVRAAQSLGARPRQLFLHVILPAALPEILTGIRLGVHRRRGRPRLPHQRRTQFLPGGPDAGGRGPPGPARLPRQRGGRLARAPPPSMAARRLDIRRGPRRPSPEPPPEPDCAGSVGVRSGTARRPRWHLLRSSIPRGGY